jgi:hypothetical protein
MVLHVYYENVFNLYSDTDSFQFVMYQNGDKQIIYDFFNSRGFLILLHILSKSKCIFKDMCLFMLFLKSVWAHFFLLIKYVKRLDIRTHYLL